MSLARQNPKRDANERQIVKALEAVGATVERISGKRVGDLLVGFRGTNYQLEVKMPGSQPNDGQKAFAREWRGQYAVVRTEQEALRAVGVVLT